MYIAINRIRALYIHNGNATASRYSCCKMSMKDVRLPPRIIPLLQMWLSDGMSLGSATAVMITGPATKITNLGALKIAMGWKRFLLYIAFIMLFSLVSGMAVNLFIPVHTP